MFHHKSVMTNGPLRHRAQHNDEQLSDKHMGWRCSDICENTQKQWFPQSAMLQQEFDLLPVLDDICHEMVEAQAVMALQFQRTVIKFDYSCAELSQMNQRLETQDSPLMCASHADVADLGFPNASLLCFICALPVNDVMSIIAQLCAAPTIASERGAAPKLAFFVDCEYHQSKFTFFLLSGMVVLTFR